MKVHYLKTWLVYFDRIVSGQKTFEVRKNDRDFQVGDTVILQTYDYENKEYGVGEFHATITYVLPGGQFGIEHGYCVFGIRAI